MSNMLCSIILLNTLHCTIEILYFRCWVKQKKKTINFEINVFLKFVLNFLNTNTIFTHWLQAWIFFFRNKKKFEKYICIFFSLIMLILFICYMCRPMRASLRTSNIRRYTHERTSWNLSIKTIWHVEKRGVNVRNQIFSFFFNF